MAANFGVNVTVVAKAARPIKVESITPIGMVAMCNELDAGLHFFGSVSKALEGLKETIGTAYLSMQLIDFQGVETPIILSTFKEVTEVDEEQKEAMTKSAVINAIDKFRTAEGATGYKPDIIIAPFFSHDADVAAKIIAIGEKLHSTQICDIEAEDEPSVIEAATTLSSKRLLLTHPKVQVWDTVSNSNVNVPLSPIIAGMIARVDGESEYGFSDSFSNRAINGISGVERPIEFMLGETCEADRLRAKNITTVIRYQGFRAWGGETSSDDEIWRDLARVRVFDRVSEAAQKGVFFAIDKKADQLYYAKLSVEELLRNLTGARVLIGYNVYWDMERNTNTTITQGKFYLNIEMQNNPIVKTLELEFAYVDKYGDVLLADLSK